MGETSYLPGITQSKAYTGTAAAIDTKLTTTKVRIWASTDCFVAFGASPTATSSDMPITALQPEYFDITPGHKISAIRQSASGTLYVTEMSKP